MKLMDKLLIGFYLFVIVFVLSFTTGNYNSHCKGFVDDFPAYIDESALLRSVVCTDPIIEQNISSGFDSSLLLPLESKPKAVEVIYESQEHLRQKTIAFLISYLKIALTIYFVVRILSILSSAYPDNKDYARAYQFLDKLWAFMAYLIMFIIVLSARTILRLI